MTFDTNWQGRTVLVTGCTGFVGGRLSSRLSESGARVIGLSRRKTRGSEIALEGTPKHRMTLIEGSISDRTLLHRTMREHDVDTVFHLASQAKVNIGRRSPVETFETNISGTWNVLEAAVASQQKVRVMVASTEGVYAEYGEQPYTENSLVDPPCPYTASKVCAEVLAKCYYRNYGLPVCVARTCNVYGGGDTSFERIIPGTICSVLSGEAPVIRSDGSPRREYLYVEDAIAGYMMLVQAMDDENICGETFNFSSGAPVSVLTLVETIVHLMGDEALNPNVIGARSNEAPVRQASSSKASEKLGWRAETSLEAGLKKTIAWYQAHANGSLTEVQSQ